MPDELSGGMKRRVGLARALITEPPVLLYDSPTAGLDPVTSQTILTLIIKLRDTRGASALYVTQRLQDAFILAGNVFDESNGALKPVAGDGFHPERSRGADVTRTRFLLLRDGGIHFQGTPEELLAARDPYLQRFLA